jgi:hypothetical protein
MRPDIAAQLFREFAGLDNITRKEPMMDILAIAKQHGAITYEMLTDIHFQHPSQLEAFAASIRAESFQQGCDSMQLAMSQQEPVAWVPCGDADYQETAPAWNMITTSKEQVAWWLSECRLRVRPVHLGPPAPATKQTCQHSTTDLGGYCVICKTLIDPPSPPATKKEGE